MKNTTRNTIQKKAERFQKEVTRVLILKLKQQGISSIEPKQIIAATS